MARRDDGSGTVWVHEPPIRQGEPDDEVRPVEPFPPPAAPAPAPAKAPVPQAYVAPAPPPQRSSSTGCLFALFIFGGVAFGFAVVVAIAVVGGLIYTQAG